MKLIMTIATIAIGAGAGYGYYKLIGCRGG